jgi:hypothetical protein
MNTANKNESRDNGTGRFTFSKWDALCTCGHKLGEHTAESEDGIRPCISGDFTGIPCDCESFRKNRKK